MSGFNIFQQRGLNGSLVFFFKLKIGFENILTNNLGLTYMFLLWGVIYFKAISKYLDV